VVAPLGDHMEAVGDDNIVDRAGQGSGRPGRTRRGGSWDYDVRRGPAAVSLGLAALGRACGLVGHRMRCSARAGGAQSRYDRKAERASLSCADISVTSARMSSSKGLSEGDPSPTACVSSQRR